MILLVLIFMYIFNMFTLTVSPHNAKMKEDHREMKALHTYVQCKYLKIRPSFRSLDLHLSNQDMTFY